MTDRKAFFNSHADQHELESQAVDTVATNRWLAAIKLSEIHEQWSAELLWKLKIDEDQNARDAAVNALKSFPAEILSKLGSVDSTSEIVAEDYSDFESWKFGILSPWSSDTKDEYEGAALTIVEHEGPTTGGRIQRLLELAARPGGGGKITQAKLRPLLENLISANALTRADEFYDSDNIDLWILHVPGHPAVVLRPRNERLLTELPVNEARQVLLRDQRYLRRPDNREVAFAALQRHYEIHANEFFLVGEALEGQWQNLFRALKHE